MKIGNEETTKKGATVEQENPNTSDKKLVLITITNLLRSFLLAFNKKHLQITK